MFNMPHNKGPNTRAREDKDTSEAPTWMVNYMQKFKEELFRELDDNIQKSVDVAVTKATTIINNREAANTAMITVMKQQNRTILERMIQMEARSMRDNLQISGLPDDTGETPATLRDSIKRILTDDLELTDDISIIRCHRNPKPDARKGPRNITVKLANRDDVQTILRATYKLQNRTPAIYINQQYPKEIVDRRRVLRPVYKEARAQGYQAKMRDDRLYINNKLYVADDIMTVPFSISGIHERRSNNCVTFLGQFSELSNFHLSPFEHDSTTYSCNEQFYQVKKAEHVNDHIVKAAIMLSDIPREMKFHGDTIVMNANQVKSWNEKRDDVMKTGLLAKFMQNPNLKDILQSTKS